MLSLLTVLPGQKKQTYGGWYSFNAVCCHHFGHNPDRRSRGGLVINGNDQVYHCFNCGFKCGFTLGKPITSKFRKLLLWSGVDEEQIQKWSLESIRQRELLDLILPSSKIKTIKFNEVDLPANSIFIDSNNADHKKFAAYLNSRSINLTDYPMLVTPNELGRMGNRIIIPYTYQNKIVGYSSRFLDNKTPKYINDQQTGFVFGVDLQKPNWQICILVEGIFDALSINGCAVLHNDISNEQAQILSRLNRPIIYVPDRDKTGLDLCERALELGYSVSIPDWHSDVKDVNDAVCKYGKLSTLLSIVNSATSSKIKIEMKRRRIEHRI